MSDLASLVIGLRADVAQLQSDLGKATQLNKSYASAAQQTFTAAASAAGDAFRDLAGQVAAAFTIDKVVEFSRSLIDAQAQVGRIATTVGVSAESFSALRTQAALTDTSVDSLQGGLSRLAKNATEAAGGNRQAAAAFSAIGVSVRDASGNLKPLDQLLFDVSNSLAGYRDGTTKTTEAQLLFGRSGNDLLPLLQDLASKGFAGVTTEAAKYGQVIGTDAAKASAEFNDNLTKLRLETEGFGSAVLNQVLPGMNKLVSEFADARSTTDGYAQSASAIAGIVKGVALAFDTLANSVHGAVSVIYGSADVIKTAIALPFQAGLATAQNGITGLKSAFSQAATQIKGAWAGSSGGVIDSVSSVGKAFTALFGTFANVSSGSASVAQHLKTLKPPLDEAADSTAELAKEQLDFARFLDGLNAKVGDISERALADFSAAVDTADKKILEMLGHGLSLEDAIKLDAQATDAATAAMWRSIAADVEKNDQADDLIQHLMDQNAQVTAVTNAQRAQVEVQELVNKALATNHDLYGQQYSSAQQANDAIQKQVPLLTQDATALHDQHDALVASNQAARDWANIFTQAGSAVADAIGKAVVEGGSFLKSLADIAKQIVEEIISYFARLAFINPILNAIFGGTAGFSALPTLGAGLFSAGASAATGGTTFSSATSLFSAGETIWHGFSNAMSSFFNGSGQTLPFANYLGSNLFGPGMETQFVPSTLGYGLSIAGGAYAAYNEFNRAGGGAAGVAGGLTYGLGTTAIGLGAAGVATGAGFAAGVGALGALGPIGWAAIALMAVDMLSGGKLFGTAGKFNFGQQAITVGASGATVTQGYDLKGQGALFSGSTHKWVTTDPSQAAINAANDFFDQLTKSTEEFAKQFGVKMGDIVGGQFVQTFDKHGNVTGTSTTIAGHTYTGETAQQFQERIIAENELSVLGQFDTKLSAAIDQYRANADQFAAIVNELAQAQLAMNNGEHFLALGADQSTSSLLALAAANQAFGETIDQTLGRLIQAQAQYDQFVAQFKTTNYVDDFEAALANIRNQMLANIKQANALAQAAGAAGASEEDLANIHSYAAQQAAAAIKALESSAQSLAFQLGLTTVGSLDDVNSEIQQLEAKANAGKTAVQGFGSAINDAAQKATDAMNLLLGDLSPLNDQQKLQTALQGLRAGTVTQSQVLEIGRRLYASSQAYNDLFATVQAIGPHTATQGGVSSGVGHGGLTGAEQQRLSDLLKEQQQLQAAAQLQQYQTLAQQIAEIASAKGEDWRQVLSDMKINIQDFEKGLGLNDKQTDDYITSQQKLLDSNNENTSSIIDAINQTTDAVNALNVTLGGTPPAGPTQTDQTNTNTPPAHGSHGYPLGRDVYRGFRDAMQSSQPRSSRTRVPA